MLEWWQLLALGIGGGAVGYVGIKILAPDVAEKITEKVTQVIPAWVSTLPAAAMEQMKAVSVGATEKMAEVAAGAQETIKETTAGALETVKETTSGALETIKETTSGALETVKESTKTFADKITDAFTSGYDAAKASLEPIIGQVKEIGGKFFEWTGTAWEQVKEKVDEVVGPIIGELKKIGENWYEWTKEGWQAIKEKVEEVVEPVKDFFANPLAWLANTIGGWLWGRVYEPTPLPYREGAVPLWRPILW